MRLFSVSYKTRMKLQIGFGLLIAVGSIIAGNYSAEIDAALGIDNSSIIFTILLWVGFALAVYALIRYAVRAVKQKTRGLLTKAVKSAATSLEKQVTPPSSETKYKLRESVSEK